MTKPERWTKAKVHPDMWVDPDEDPRNNQGPSPDGEAATLDDYLAGYRLTVRMKCDGLTPSRWPSGRSRPRACRCWG